MQTHHNKTNHVECQQRLTKIQCFSEVILQLPEDDTMVLKHVWV